MAVTAEHFDAVIVGSGFGGSVMAYRLAEAGLRVCVLERGRIYPPGSFPRSPYRMRRAFWDPSEGQYGMFDIWSFRNFGAVISSGLGGGSLIYASVMLRKPPATFVREEPGAGYYEHWPVTYDDLEPHYERAEQMLGAQAYPFEHRPYSDTPRTRAMVDAAEKLRLPWTLPKQAVTFGIEGQRPVPGEPILGEPENIHGRTRSTCRLVGECDIGCNYGSKNTLDYNYLSAAWRLGADLRWLHEVRNFAPREGGGYTVAYVVHDPQREDRRSRTHDPSILPVASMTADRLILSAGTLGSTFLLLRNQSSFPGLSPAIGTRFSGNGDLLTLAIKPTHTLRGRKVSRPVEGGVGPAITIAIPYPALPARGGDEGTTATRGVGEFYLEDAGYPDLLNWMMQTTGFAGALWRWRHIGWRLLLGRLTGRTETNLSAELAALLGSAELSAGMLPLLGMGRDVADGRMRLRDDRLDIDWRIDASTPYFRRARAEMQRFAKALGATFADNPMWHVGRRVVTVHPLGGLPMGRDASEGVVDARGRVFGHPGLYVADGSVMPGPIGPNPSLTIAALADRFADGLIEEWRSGRDA
jgi:cholesterol oxidase